MAYTPAGVYYPAGSDDFMSAPAQIEQLAESITGQVLQAASQTAANALKTQIQPTAARPLYVWRSDVNEVWISTGGDFQQFAKPAVTGMCMWGKDASQNFTEDDPAAALVGWSLMDQGGFTSATANSDGTFTILGDGPHDLLCHCGVAAASEAGSANSSLQLSLHINGDVRGWDYVSVVTPGYRTLAVTQSAMLHAGDEVYFGIRQYNKGEYTYQTYPSRRGVYMTIAKTG